MRAFPAQVVRSVLPGSRARGARAWLLLGCALLALGSPLQAATYYIDYVSGSDSNSGTSKSAPFRRHPFMKSFGGNYRHAAGDRFIFKGGVTWPNACFQMKVSAGGSSANPDYYGTDESWYNGSSWSRPKWDFENISTGTWTDNYGVYVTAGSPYIVFDGLEMMRHRGEPRHGSATVTVAFSGTGSVAFSNCVVRDWSLSAPLPAGVGAGNLGGGIWWTGGSGVVKVSHCELHQQNVASSSGIAVRAANVLEYTHIHHAGTAWTGGGTVRYNTIHDLKLPTVDPTAHLAAIKTFAVSEIYGNVIYNTDGSVAPIELSEGFSSSSGTTIVHNNLVYDTSVQPPVWLKTDRATYADIRIKILNNTIVRSGGICVSIYDGGAGVKLASADVRNNHFITEGEPVSISNVASLTVANNLSHTVSEAARLGYSKANSYRPTSSSSPTVGRGVKLSEFTTDRLEVTRGATWDIGAYQWQGGTGGTTPGNGSDGEPTPPVPPTVALAGLSPGQSVSGTLTLTATASPGSSGAVATVQFFVDEALIGTGAFDGAGFRISWDSASVANGTHDLKVIGTDLSGNHSAPARISVAVNNTPAQPQPDPEPTLPSDLVLHLPLNDAGGSVASDASGFGNDVACLNSPVWAQGRSAGGLCLDGVDDYLRCPSSPSLESIGSQLTISCWVLVEANGSWQAVARKLLREGTHDYPYSAYDLIIEDTAGVARARMAVSRADGVRQVCYSSAGLQYGTWCHLAGVYDGAELSLYVNGQLAGQTQFTGSIARTGQPLLIGRNGIGGDVYKGRLDDFRLWNRALSASEIRSLCTSSGPRPPSNLRVVVVN